MSLYYGRGVLYIHFVFLLFFLFFFRFTGLSLRFRARKPESLLIILCMCVCVFFIQFPIVLKHSLLISMHSSSSLIGQFHKLKRLAINPNEQKRHEKDTNY